MSSKTRLANKTIWALEDIVAVCGEAWRDYQAAKKRARRTRDTVMLAHLSDLADHLMVIERKARDARQGDYRE